MADQRLYKLVKWCKSLPLFKNIMVSLSLYFSLSLTFSSLRLTTKYRC